MDESLRAGIYVRVSRKEQASDEHFSIPAQLRETRKFVQGKGWIVVETYIDKGYTGRNDRRPQFRRMMADVRAGRIDVVVVHKLDRFSRSIFDILKYWKALQEEYDASFASATERFDFTTPEGKLQFHIMAAFAQWYSENLSRETIKGKKERALSGKYNGVLPFGYVKDERGEAVIEPHEAEGVRIAFEAYATGNYSDGQVADLLNRHKYITRHNRQWTKDSVRDFLRNAFYTGQTKYHGELLPGNHEAIVTQELFDKCQRVRKSRRSCPRSHTPKLRTYLLNKILRCAGCGRKLRAQNSSDYRYYREMSHTRKLPCPLNGNRGVRAEVFEEQLGRVFSAFQLPEDWQQDIQDQVTSKSDRQMIIEQRDRIERKLARVAELYRDLVIDNEQYQRERDQLQSELKTLVIPEEEEMAEAGIYLEDISELWDEATLEEQRDIVRLVLNEVYCDMQEARLTTLVPKPIFRLFFDQHPMLQETKEGQFDIIYSGMESTIPKKATVMT
jgi:DNA invertase Pin-like site-specific DNA recombinase